jgi:hypothetical protein
MGEIASTAAWYAAIVATLSLLFNLMKWVRERARLSVRIIPTVYEDGGFSKVEKTPHGEVSTPILYYHIEVINVGERPTTIMGVSATTRDTFWDKVLRSTKTFDGEIGIVGSVFSPHYGKHLPYVIGPGEVWSCRVPISRVDDLQQGGRPKLALTATCRQKPILIPFPLHRQNANAAGNGES